MSEDRLPAVSIGVPVYRGEAYLAAALDAILGQTFTDFEVIVSDNRSDDRTFEIARSYAARDRRIQLIRTVKNLGAVPNFNRTFVLARGRYFKWAAHDDLIEPTYLERCVEVLDARPDVVLCHSQVGIIDPDGRPIRDHRYTHDTEAESAVRRFQELLLVRGHQCYEVFGLIRSDVLRATRLMGAYPAGDRVLLAELALRGRFHEVPERLFLSREHPDRSVRRLVSQQERAPWFDSRYRSRLVFPEWRQLGEYCRAIADAPLGPAERLELGSIMLRWVRQYRKRMRNDLWVAARAVRGRMRPAAA